MGATQNYSCLFFGKDSNKDFADGRRPSGILDYLDPCGGEKHGT
jgi:hypothetical protein